MTIRFWWMAAVVAAATCGGGDDDPPLPRPVRFTLAATGDVLVHAQVAEAAQRLAGESGFNFGPLFEEVAPILDSADLTICHLETPLSASGQSLAYGPRFSVPGEVAAALAGAGYDACSTASNHALDAGETGIRATLELLDGAGLAHAGTARTQREADTPVLVAAGRDTVGLLSYTYGFNAEAAPSGPSWLANRIDGAAILNQARQARAAGADFVVVSLHWGTEYQSRPEPGQRALARRLLASPAVDLILGHHAHVVQPVERLGTKYAVYGLGNFLSGQPDRCCPSPRDGVIVRLEVEKTGAGLRVGRVTYSPTRVETGSYRIRLLARALTEANLTPSRRGALTGAWCRTVAAIGDGAEPIGRDRRCSS